MKVLDTKARLGLFLAVGTAECYSVLCDTPVYANATKKQNQEKIVESVEDTAKTLQLLVHNEIDASFLFSQAIENVKNKAIKGYLVEAKAECENNIKTLSSLLSQYGKEAPEHTKDFKGYFMQGYLAMRGCTSDQGLMSALYSNLKMLLGAYEDALKREFREDVKEKIAQLYENAKAHLSYVEGQM